MTDQELVDLIRHASEQAIAAILRVADLAPKSDQIIVISAALSMVSVRGQRFANDIGFTQHADLIKEGVNMLRG